MTLSLFPVVISMDFKSKSHWTHDKTGSTQGSKNQNDPSRTGRSGISTRSKVNGPRGWIWIVLEVGRKWVAQKWTIEVNWTMHQSGRSKTIIKANVNDQAPRIKMDDHSNQSKKNSMVKMNGSLCSKGRSVLSFGTSSFFESVLFDTRPLMGRPLSMDWTMQFNPNERPIWCMSHIWPSTLNWSNSKPTLNQNKPHKLAQILDQN